MSTNNNLIGVQLQSILIQTMHYRFYSLKNDLYKIKRAANAALFILYM